MHLTLKQCQVISKVVGDIAIAHLNEMSESELDAIYEANRTLREILVKGQEESRKSSQKIMERRKSNPSYARSKKK